MCPQKVKCSSKGGHILLLAQLKDGKFIKAILVIDRKLCIKKVDFEKVRHSFSEKVSSYKKVFSVKKYHL